MLVPLATPLNVPPSALLGRAVLDLHNPLLAFQPTSPSPDLDALLASHALAPVEESQLTASDHIFRARSWALASLGRHAHRRATTHARAARGRSYRVAQWRDVWAALQRDPGTGAQLEAMTRGTGGRAFLVVGVRTMEDPRTETAAADTGTAGAALCVPLPPLATALGARLNASYAGERERSSEFRTSSRGELVVALEYLEVWMDGCAPPPPLPPLCASDMLERAGATIQEKGTAAKASLQRHPTATRFGTALLVGAGVAVATPLVVGAVLGGIGFTAGGVAAGSLAAAMQGPAVVAGSAFAVAQSVGAAGLAATTIAAAGGVAGAGAFGIASVVDAVKGSKTVPCVQEKTPRAPRESVEVRLRRVCAA